MVKQREISNIQLEEAKQKGYILIESNEDSHITLKVEQEFYKWCQDNKRPFIHIFRNLSKSSHSTIRIDFLTVPSSVTNPKLVEESIQELRQKIQGVIKSGISEGVFTQDTSYSAGLEVRIENFRFADQWYYLNKVIELAYNHFEIDRPPILEGDKI